MSAKQEILEELEEIDYAFGTFYTERIRAILETHTLEPIDEREFDPALCGCVRITSDARLYVWNIGATSILQRENRMEIWTEKKICDCTWPATQSDGERLLKLLGVLR